MLSILIYELVGWPIWSSFCSFVVGDSCYKVCLTSLLFYKAIIRSRLLPPLYALCQERYKVTGLSEETDWIFLSVLWCLPGCVINSHRMAPKYATRGHPGHEIRRFENALLGDAVQAQGESPASLGSLMFPPGFRPARRYEQNNPH